MVTVNGDGTFDDGTQTQTLRNRTPVETGADAKGYMEYTLHTLRVTGATGATTFTIATSLDGTGAVTGSNSCRMWFDDLRIERELALRKLIKAAVRASDGCFLDKGRS